MLRVVEYRGRDEARLAGRQRAWRKRRDQARRRQGNLCWVGRRGDSGRRCLRPRVGDVPVEGGGVRGALSECRRWDKLSPVLFKNVLREEQSSSKNSQIEQGENCDKIKNSFKNQNCFPLEIKSLQA